MNLIVIIIFILVIEGILILASAIYNTELCSDLIEHFKNRKTKAERKKEKLKIQEEKKRNLIRINQYKDHFSIWTVQRVINNIPFTVYDITIIDNENKVRLKHRAMTNTALADYFSKTIFDIENMYVSLDNSSIVLLVRQNPLRVI